MKAKFLVGTTEESDDSEWRDFYFDEDKLSVYWLPNLMDGEEKSVNVVIDGNKYTLLQEKKLLEFLRKFRAL